MGPTAFAKRHGVSAVTIHNWLRKGLIERTASGQIDPSTEDPKVWAHKGIKKPGTMGGRPRKKHNVADQITPHDIDAAKLKETAAKADKARMIADELAGKLVPVARVEQEITRGFGALKVRVLTLGDRLAQRLAPLGDPQVIRTTIEAECRELLEAAAEEILNP